MTFRQHQSYLSEVGSQVSKFAAPSEVVFIQEEIAHHLEEQTFFLLDQGFDLEKAQEESLRLLGSSRSLVKSIRRSFRSAEWMIFGSCLFAVSAVALAVPLRDLTSKGVLIQALSVLFSIGAFALAAAGCGLGAKIGIHRILLTLGASACLFFLAPQPEPPKTHRLESALPSGRVLLREPPNQDLRFAVPDGKVFTLSAANPDGVSSWSVSEGSAAQSAPPLPEKFKELIRSFSSAGASLTAEPERQNRDSYLVWAWGLSMALITGGAFGAAALGERKRAAYYKRQAPPSGPPSGPTAG